MFGIDIATLTLDRITSLGINQGHIHEVSCRLSITEYGGSTSMYQRERAAQTHEEALDYKMWRLLITNMENYYYYYSTLFNMVSKTQLGGSLDIPTIA